MQRLESGCRPGRHGPTPGGAGCPARSPLALISGTLPIKNDKHHSGCFIQNGFTKLGLQVRVASTGPSHFYQVKDLNQFPKEKETKRLRGRAPVTYKISTIPALKLTA